MFLMATFLDQQFSYNTLISILMMLSVILLFMLMILLSTLLLSGMWLWQQLELSSKLEFYLYDTVDWGRKWFVNFCAGKTQPVLFDWCNNSSVIEVKIDEPNLEEKSSVKILGPFFSPELDWVSVTLFPLPKLSPRKLEPYLFKSTIWPCIEYCCPVWAFVPSCYLDVLGKLQKWLCRIISPTFAALFEPLSHQRNVVSLRLFCRFYFGRYSSGLAELVLLPFSCESSTCYSNRLHDFPNAVVRWY